MAQPLSVAYATQDVNTALIHPVRRSMSFYIIFPLVTRHNP